MQNEILMQTLQRLKSLNEKGKENNKILGDKIELLISKTQKHYKNDVFLILKQILSNYIVKKIAVNKLFRVLNSKTNNFQLEFLKTSFSSCQKNNQSEKHIFHLNSKKNKLNQSLRKLNKLLDLSKPSISHKNFNDFLHLEMAYLQLKRIFRILNQKNLAVSFQKIYWVSLCKKINKEKIDILIRNLENFTKKSVFFSWQKLKISNCSILIANLEKNNKFFNLYFSVYQILKQKKINFFLLLKKNVNYSYKTKLFQKIILFFLNHKEFHLKKNAYYKIQKNLLFSKKKLQFFKKIKQIMKKNVFSTFKNNINEKNVYLTHLIKFTKILEEKVKIKKFQIFNLLIKNYLKSSKKDFFKKFLNFLSQKLKLYKIQIFNQFRGKILTNSQWEIDRRDFFKKLVENTNYTDREIINLVREFIKTKGKYINPQKIISCYGIFIFLTKKTSKINFQLNSFFFSFGKSLLRKVKEKKEKFFKNSLIAILKLNNTVNKICISHEHFWVLKGFNVVKHFYEISKDKENQLKKKIEKTFILENFIVILKSLYKNKNQLLLTIFFFNMRLRNSKYSNFNRITKKTKQLQKIITHFLKKNLFQKWKTNIKIYKKTYDIPIKDIRNCLGSNEPSAAQIIRKSENYADVFNEKLFLLKKKFALEKNLPKNSDEQPTKENDRPIKYLNPILLKDDPFRRFKHMK